MPFKINAQSRWQNWEISINRAGLTLLEILQQHQVPIRSSCMGKGLCHQCRIRVTQGMAPASHTDQKFFSPAQIADGWRHSCTLRPKLNSEVFIPQVYDFVDHFHWRRAPVSPWWVAADLGTTGIELAAVDRDGIWAQVKALNRQIAMGADVMTRLAWAQKNGSSLLTQKLHTQIAQLISEFSHKSTEQSSFLFNGQIIAAGNSAITTFMTDMSFESLAVAPYLPASVSAQKVQFFGMHAQTLPLLHGFVGGDLYAGLFYLWHHLGKTEFLRESWILADIGTNSEILYWDKNRLFVTSTPAGPAFEGSSISIGMRAERGAIVEPHWSQQEKRWHFRVIDDDIPRGICGSGLIELIDEAIRCEFIAPDGVVIATEGLRLNSDLEILQDDIREFQLAKAAIQAGLLLIQKSGEIPPSRLYLAGAFGEHLPLHAGRNLGMLPHLATETLGNASLLGTIFWGQATAEDGRLFDTWLRQHLTPIDLATRDEFQAVFIESLHLRNQV